MKYLIWILVALLLGSENPDSVNESEGDGQVRPTQEKTQYSIQELAGYDFDGDGVSEMVKKIESLGYDNYFVYEKSGNELNEMGMFTSVSEGFQCGVLDNGTIKKYYDASANSYFYFNDYIIQKDEWFYYHANKYKLIEGRFECEGICYVEGVTSDENQFYVFTNYFGGEFCENGLMEYSECASFYEKVENYLKQYEAVETIALGELKAEVYDTFKLNLDDKRSSFVAENKQMMHIEQGIDKESLKSLEQVEVLLGGVTADYVDVLKDMDSLKFVMLNADSDEADYFKFLSDLPNLEGVLLTSNVTDVQMEYIRQNMPWIKFVYRRWY